MAFNAFYGQRYSNIDDQDVSLNDMNYPQNPQAAAAFQTTNPYDQNTGYHGAGMGQDQYGQIPPYESRPRPASIYSNYSGFENDQKAFDNLPSDAQGVQTRPSFIIPPQGEEGPNPYSRKFNRTRQLWYLIMWTLIRWFGTALLIASMIGTFIFFEKKTVMTSVEKRVFNTFVTGEALFLGLNIASSFKSQMMSARWKILARKQHTAEDVDLILDFASMSKNLALILKGSTYFSLRIGLAIWLLLNLGGQLATALIGLTYELNSYTSNTEWKTGLVEVPVLSSFLPGWNHSALIQGNNQFISHLYGDTATSFKSSDYDAKLNLVDGSVYNHDTSRQNFTYRFRDWVPGDSSRFTLTNRTVSSSSICTTHPVLRGELGNFTSVDVQFPDGEKNVPLPAGGGQNAIHYVLPGQFAFGYCGNQCSTVWVFQPLWQNDTSTVPAQFFDCNITLTPVANPYYEVHNISDLILQIAAAAVSLSGFANLELKQSQQFESTRYLYGSYYGTPVTFDANGIQSLLSEFAIGVVAGLGQLNTRMNVTGQRPLQGVQLQVRWDRLGVLLGIIGLGQLILLLSANIWANTVIVRDGSYLAMARILRPLVEPFGRNGCLVDGKAIAESFKQPLLYGVRTLRFPQSRGPKDDLHHLEIGPVDAKLKAQFWFPEGTYD